MVVFDPDKLVALNQQLKTPKIRRHPVTGLPMSHGEWISYRMRLLTAQRWEWRNRRFGRPGWSPKPEPPNRIKDRIVLAFRPGEVLTRPDLKARGFEHYELTYPLHRLVRSGYVAEHPNEEFQDLKRASGPQACPNVYTLTAAGLELREALAELVEMLK